MQPKERWESGEQDLFRARLDQIIDLEHALVRLAKAIEWRFLEEQFGAVYSDKPGHPPLPPRLMAGLAILKHMYDLSDEAACARSDCEIVAGHREMVHPHRHISQSDKGLRSDPCLPNPFGNTWQCCLINEALVLLDPWDVGIAKYRDRTGGPFGGKRSRATT